jgi:hypothetical protein
MNEIRAYIERGRRFQTLSNDEIVNSWVATFGSIVQPPGGLRGRLCLGRKQKNRT